MTVVNGVIMILTSGTAGPIFNKFTRKKTFVIGYVILFVLLAITGVLCIFTDGKDDISTALAVLIIACVFLYLWIFSWAAGPLAWLYNAEI